MLSDHAKRKFNSLPVICYDCKQQTPNYRVLLDDSNNLLCFQCSAKDHQSLKKIRKSYKQTIFELIKKLPVPDCKLAQACIVQTQNLKKIAHSIIDSIKQKLGQFEKQLQDFLEQTRIICEGYLKNLNKIQDQKIENWHRSPPHFINQERYVLNIRQKYKMAIGIKEQIQNYNFSLPSFELAKKKFETNFSKHKICQHSSITTAIQSNGSLFFGTSTGQVIFESGLEINRFSAHPHLIRSMVHDGQYRLFTGSDDSTIKAWSFQDSTPQLLGTFGQIQGIKSYHRQMVIMEDGKIMASSRGQFDEYRIRLWDLNTYEHIHVLEGHTNFIKCMIGQGLSQLITVSQDRYLKIWSTKTLNCLQEYFHSRKINYVFQNVENELFCLIDQDTRIIILDVKTLTLINGIYLGKKTNLAFSGSFIYINIGTNLHVYNWLCHKQQTIQIIQNATNLLQLGNKIVATDGFGYIHFYSPKSLKNR